MTVLLEGRDLSYRRNEALILNNVSLSLSKGDLIALLGINGAGKSTLLRLLLGLLTPEKGEVFLHDQSLKAMNRKAIARHIAYVPQEHKAVFSYTVEEIIALGRLPYIGFGQNLSRSDQDAVQQSLEYLKINHLKNRPYTELSGGERQSVLLARALAQGAHILILDEPETGLDFGQQLRLAALLQDLSRDGYSILATTHDPLRARQIFSRAVLLQQGQIIGDGAPQDVLTRSAIESLYHIDKTMTVPWD
ncbi:MAG: ABC transporter ATP-binding protein [Zymomonas mobilis]|uniref:Iron complex transport system ATP-binding protein n=1 Tax=Zymomonas mobilis TaxID=542 RepID=A0A542W3H5_ZYMMB|nr:ABC transporter ATP-binding protein [Zymomonas mobilis]TQL18124.1 iron complex transport system ATP-binding protein [Zymomonas mobilis]